MNGVQKQQPCEDCISRESVNILVDELARAISDERCFMSRGRSTTTIMQDILDLPPVIPKRSTGKWLVLSYGFSPYGCSECGAVVFSKSNYCPKCGAKMEVEE